MDFDGFELFSLSKKNLPKVNDLSELFGSTNNREMSICLVHYVGSRKHHRSGRTQKMKKGDTMLLNNYRMEIFNNECMPSAMSVQCFAHLDQDVSLALPYLNAVLGGFEYLKEPPSVTFRAQGKLITVHGQKIAVNTIKDGNEARKIVEWIIREINDAWEKRDEIEPSYEGMPRPKVIEILKLLPKINCRECGVPTCMVFATLVAEGAKDASNCPPLGKEDKKKLAVYMEQFRLDM